MRGLRDYGLTGLALAIALSCASAAAAQESSRAPLDNEIVVEGYTKKEVRNFLWRSIIETGPVIARRNGPVCVGIDNVPAELSQPLKARIETNLDQLGIERDAPGCKVNAVIAFDRDAHRFVNALSRHEGGIAFGALYLPEMRRLIRPVRPAYNWHFINLELIQWGLGTGQPLNRQGFGGRGFQIAGFDATSGSRLAAYSEPAEISKTFSVVDIDAIDGITIEQLADYLTMHMLVEFRPDMKGQVPADSILNLFTNAGTNPDAAPGMSMLDRIIVSEMYKRRRSFAVGGIRNGIARRAVAQLDQAGALIGEP